MIHTRSANYMIYLLLAKSLADSIESCVRKLDV